MTLAPFITKDLEMRSLSLPAPFALPRIRRRPAPLARVVAALDLWRQRRALAALDDARPADLGLTRGQARSESGRPFWDAPKHWL